MQSFTDEEDPFATEDENPVWPDRAKPSPKPVEIPAPRPRFIEIGWHCAECGEWNRQIVDRENRCGGCGELVNRQMQPDRLLQQIKEQQEIIQSLLLRVESLEMTRERTCR